MKIQLTDKEKLEKLKPFSFDKYRHVDLDHLITYVMGQLEKLEADLSFENAVVGAVKLFPEKFSLLGFPGYPDSLRVYSCLWRCSTDKKRQWLGGKARQGFFLTDKSRKIIAEAERLLTGSQQTSTGTSSLTRRKEFLLAEVASSSAYIRYAKGEKDSITEADLCDLLQGTLDTSRDILRGNLLLLKKYAEELDKKGILVFMVWLEERFKKFLS
jgi:hypothetical protein